MRANPQGDPDPGHGTSGLSLGQVPLRNRQALGGADVQPVALVDQTEHAGQSATLAPGIPVERSQRKGLRPAPSKKPGVQHL